MSNYILKKDETFTMKSLIKLLEKYDSIKINDIVITKDELQELEKFIKLTTLSYSLVTKKKLNQLKKKGKVLGRPKGATGKNNIKDKYLPLIKALHKEGMTYIEIAKKLKIAISSIYRIKKDLD